MDSRIQTIVVPRYNSAGQLQNPMIYTFDTNNKLGEGLNGKVYKGQWINNKGQPITCAIKVINDLVTFNEKELEILQQHYHAEKHEQYILTNFIPGKSILTDKFVIHPQLAQLSFLQKINLINQIVLQLNQLHHDTISTGKAVVHGDIKGSNINVFIDPESGRSEAFLIDFGLAFQIEDDANLTRIHPKKIYGNSLYFPIETLEQNFGIKTDLYMLVNVICLILGDDNPLRDRQKIINKPFERANTPYAIDRIIIPEIVSDIYLKDLICQFLNRMQQNNYAQRPDSDEVLQFFTSLNILLKTYAKNPEDREGIHCHAAKLVLLAQGTWYKPHELVLTTKQMMRSQKFIPKHFDFANYPTICKSIVMYHNVRNLLEQQTPQIDKMLKNYVNQQREEIVKVCILLLKKMQPAQRLSSLTQLLSGQNALGKILLQPRHSFLFNFTRHTYQNKPVTKSVYTIVNAFKQDLTAVPQNITSLSKKKFI